MFANCYYAINRHTNRRIRNSERGRGATLAGRLPRLPPGPALPELQYCLPTFLILSIGTLLSSSSISLTQQRKKMSDFTSPLFQSTSARHGKKTSPCLLCNQMDHWCKDCPLRPIQTPKSVPLRVQHGKIGTFSSSLNTPAAAASSSSLFSEKMNHGGKDTCFGCGQKGHWLKDCPRKKGSSSSSSRKQMKNYPTCMCKCGVPRIVKTSKTPKNPDKDFYICPKMQDEQCKDSFLWCDKAKELGLFDDKPNPADQYPICHCGAGKCRLLTMQEGELAGCLYFACMIKEGHGCCTHFELYTSPIGNEPNKINGGENINVSTGGLKSSPTVDVGGVEVRAQSISDEVVAPATTEARSEKRPRNVEYSPLGWLNPLDATNSDETVVRVSPSPPIQRKLEFGDTDP